MKKQTLNIFGILIFLICLPLIIPCLLWQFIIRLAIYPLIWIAWCSQKKYILFVYSNSPNWQQYIEQKIIPKLPSKTIVLNWSEKKKWKNLSLKNMVFYLWAGEHEFNSMALVFRPFHLVKDFRFWKAFKDFQHGKEYALKKIEKDFFECIKFINNK